MLATIQQCNVVNSVTDKVPIKLGDKSIQSVKVMVHRFFHWDQYLSRNLVLSLDGLHY